LFLAGVIALYILTGFTLVNAGEMGDGEALYMKNCKMCHKLNTEGISASLETMAKKYHNNSSGIVDFLNNPTGKAATMMKRFTNGLSPQEKEAVAAWMTAQGQ